MQENHSTVSLQPASPSDTTSTSCFFFCGCNSAVTSAGVHHVVTGTIEGGPPLPNPSLTNQLAPAGCSCFMGKICFSVRETEAQKSFLTGAQTRYRCCLHGHRNKLRAIYVEAGGNNYFRNIRSRDQLR